MATGEGAPSPVPHDRRAARALMLQGTGSDVGKSLLVAGLCRLAVQRGIRVLPFKPQNMSNNAAVTSDGGEIGRAQALQAQAARREPVVDMNPVLLKPEAGNGAQLVVRGRVAGRADARRYHERKPDLLAAVMQSYRRLAADADLVLVEGAGSPAEINLRNGDIANMGFSVAADVPVVLVGDIDRGGVIASLVGAHAVLDRTDRAMVRGFVINRFRGDASLFAAGVSEIERRTGWPSLGVVPWFAEAGRLPAEDALGLETMTSRGGTGIRIAVPVLPRIANFDDLDPLRCEAGVSVRMIRSGQAIPGDTDLVLLPGSKSTISDLAAVRREGWDIDIRAHVRRGGRVLGLCGGYQMLGRRIADPGGVEGPAGSAEGLGLLDIETELGSGKTVRRIRGTDLVHGQEISGYEIHLGRTSGPDCSRPMLRLCPDGNPGPAGAEPPFDDGARSVDGRVAGCYVHGLFVADGYRRAVLEALGRGQAAGLNYAAETDAILDRLAGHLDAHLDADRLFALAR